MSKRQQHTNRAVVPDHIDAVEHPFESTPEALRSSKDQQGQTEPRQKSLRTEEVRTSDDSPDYP